MQWELRRIADLTAQEQAAVQTLSRAVYPPGAEWPGRSIEWAAREQCILAWDATGQAVCHIGLHLCQGRWNERPVKIGGIGGVQTHPAFRGRGLASDGIGQALDFFRARDVDFGLLVCEPALIPFYERLGWQPFDGHLLVIQQHATVPFTFNRPMTIPVQLHESLMGRIDLMGPPW